MSRISGFVSALVLAGAVAVSPAMASVKVVGGAPMYSTKTIAQNAPNAKNLTTLVAAVKAAGLVDTLAGPGPFTVFAPTNAAFNRLPAGTVQTLVQPENKAKLTGILTYHVVAGNLSARDLMEQARANGGMVTLKTVEGDPLTVSMKGKRLYVMDESGGTAQITTADVMQANGVVHVVNRVLLPK